MSNFPGFPLTLEGSSILHQMFRVRWSSWKTLSKEQQRKVLCEAVPALEEMEQNSSGQSALFSLLGHKGDLMLLHFRNSFEELNDVELRLSSLRVAEHLEATHSYVSVVELGLYESTVRLHEALARKGIQFDTPDWDQEVSVVLAQQRKAMAPRLWPEIPPRKYVCFYPMDKKRGEQKNWYSVPIGERQRMMHEHGIIGRRYAGKVKQIISGSIGFDDWEWGVDLFADDPLVFKQLIYEMRFDEASAMYALFGSFYIGLRFAAAEIGTLLGGRRPEFVIREAT